VSRGNHCDAEPVSDLGVRMRHVNGGAFGTHDDGVDAAASSCIRIGMICPPHKPKTYPKPHSSGHRVRRRRMIALRGSALRLRISRAGGLPGR
jgi:hypothetical protein